VGEGGPGRGGTLFLDEIGELPQELQPKLLRLLNEREYERVGEARTRRADVRIISATNKDIAGAVRKGHFREDLYYRLNVISLCLPPLRERPRDILPLAAAFLRHYRGQAGRPDAGFTEAARERLVGHRWPGNIRELRNLMERTAILVDEAPVDARHLPLGAAAGSSEQDEGVRVGERFSLEELERAHIRKVLAGTRSVEEAAQVLDIHVATLYRKRKKL